MKLQAILLSFIETSKKFILTFWFNILRPSKFYFEGTYDNIKLEGKLYLFISILLYLLFYSSRHILFDNASIIYDNILDYTNINVFRTLLLTIPLYLYVIFLLWLLTLLAKGGLILPKNLFPPFASIYKKEHGGKINNTLFYVFSNILVLETFSYFFLSVLFHILSVFNLTQTANTLVSYAFAFNAKFIRYSSFIIPIYIIITILRHNKSWRNYGVLLALIPLCFADNITQSFYRYEFKLFGIKNIGPEFKKNKIDLICLDTGSKDNLVFHLKRINPDSVVMFIDVLIRNNTPDILIYRNRNRLLQPVYNNETLADHKFLNFITAHPFTEAIGDDKIVNDSNHYFILMPDIYYRLKFFSSVSLNAPEKQLLSEFEHEARDIDNPNLVLTFDESLGSKYPNGNYAVINRLIFATN